MTRAAFAVACLILPHAPSGAQEEPLPPASPETAPATPPEAPPDLPQPVQPAHFEHFLGHSPFVRTLNLAETYALRGIAEIDGVQVATLYNRQTKKSLQVTDTAVNAERMRLQSVSVADFLTEVSATIAVADDVISLKFEPERVTPAPKGSRPGSSGGSVKSGTEERRGPSTQDIEKYKALPPEKQEKLREYIRQTMTKYPEMSREERGNMIKGALTRLTEGGEITMPAPSGGGSPPAPAQPSPERR